MVDDEWGTKFRKIEIMSDTDTKKPGQYVFGASPAAPVQPLKFVHEQPPTYRIFHADGVWGMVNIQGNVQMDFFLERSPRPDFVTFQAKDGISYSEIPELKFKHGGPDDNTVMREFQAGIVMNLATAIQVHTVLGNFIRLAQTQAQVAAQIIDQKK